MPEEELFDPAGRVIGMLPEAFGGEEGKTEKLPGGGGGDFAAPKPAIPPCPSAMEGRAGIKGRSLTGVVGLACAGGGGGGDRVGAEPTLFVHGLVPTTLVVAERL